MGFFFGFFLGISLGIGIFVAFSKIQVNRSKCRSDLATTIAAFARMTVQDSRKILTPEYHPSWVNWLNTHLEKVWPYLNEAASELLRTNVESRLENYKPVILSSLKFSKLTLGNVAPSITGIAIIEGDAKKMVMEVEVQWDGNPKIVLAVKTKLGVSLPVEVKNVGFTGIFRLIFTPLVDVFPCFGAVCYSLREKKNLDFTLKVVGGEFPGISNALEDTIHGAIEDSITWPARQIISILPGDYSDLELKPVGILEVKLVQAKNLTNKDFIGKSDPYAELFIRAMPDRIKTSKIVDNELNPIWNEHFQFIVDDETTQSLKVKVYDDEGVAASDFIGCAQFHLNELEPGKVKDVWLKLVKDLVVQRDTKDRGSVHLELLYCPYGTDSAIENPFDQDFRLTSVEKVLKAGIDVTEIKKPDSVKKKEVIVRGVLSVTVIAAEHLPSVDIYGKSDPFVVILLRKSDKRNKTRVVNNCLNPVWNQTFDFVVEDGLHELLMVEVWDHDTFGKDRIGRCIMTLTRVILEREFTNTFNIDGTKGGLLHLHLKWTPQPIFFDS